MVVELVHFNPTKPGVGPLGFMRRRPLNNFGDIIGPILVRRIVKELGLAEPRERKRLIGVGSIMKLSQPGDTVWGTGINGKSLGIGGAPRLDVRAVRGPRTRSVLVAANTEVPEVYGDPALLWSRFWPRSTYKGRGETRDVTIVPNFHDYSAFEPDGRVLDPCSPYSSVIGQIANSRFVCGSSLHGIVLAESFGIPARLINSAVEPQFKYDDYYSGTSRPDYRAANSVEEAVDMGGESPPRFDEEALLSSFPSDLWEQP